jgi:heptosyltransferase-2
MNPREIVILKFGALGDVVRTAYLLPFLHARHPGARITWITSNPAVDLLRFNPYITRLLTPQLGLDSIRSDRFDLALSLDDEREVLTLLQGLHCADIVGARIEGDRVVYCDRSAAWFDMGLLSRHGKTRADELKRLNLREHHAFLGEMLGIDITAPSFFGSPVIAKDFAGRLGSEGLLIGVNCGSGGRWPSKQLSVAKAVDLVGRLVGITAGGKPARVVLLGGQGERALNDAILAGAASDRVSAMGVGLSLLEFAAVIRSCDLMVTSDSLALHLAAGQGVPTVSFFAPTSAAEIGTFGNGIKVVSTSPDYCNYRPDADTSSITVERLVDAVQALLPSIGTGRRD